MRFDELYLLNEEPWSHSVRASSAETALPALTERAGRKQGSRSYPSNQGFVVVGRGADPPELLQQVSAVRANQGLASISFHAPATEYAKRPVNALAYEQAIDVSGGVSIRGNPDI